MGRYYQTSAPNFVDDAMFVLPYQQMSLALKEKDKAINDTIESAVKLGDFTIDHHSVDRDSANAVKASWDSRINSVIDKVLENPLEFGAEKRNILQLGRELSQDRATGAIAGLSTRKANIDAFKKQMDELQQKEPVKASHAQSLYNRALAEQSSFIDPETGAINYFTAPTLHQADALTTYVEEAIKGAAGGEMTSVRSDDYGGMTVETEYGTKGFSKQRLTEIFNDYLAANPEIQKGIGQKVALGEMDFQSSFDAAQAYMLSKYGKTPVKSTVKNSINELGMHIKKSEYDDAQGAQQPGLVVETTVENALQDYRSFKNNAVANSNTFTNISTNVNEILSSTFNKDFKGADLKTKISQLKLAAAKNGVNYDATISQLQDAALKKTASDGAMEDLRTSWLSSKEYEKVKKYQKAPAKSPGKTAYDVAFNKFFAGQYAGTGPNGAYGKVGAITSGASSLTGYGTPKEITALKNTFEQNFEILPFQVQGQSFTTVGENGEKTVLQLKQPGKDAAYLRWLNSGKNSWKGADGLLHNYIDLGKDHTISTTSFDKLVRLGVLEKVNGTKKEVDASKLYSTAKKGAATETSSQSTNFKIKGSNQVITINPHTLGISGRLSQGGNDALSATVGIGNETTPLIFPLGVTNSIDLPSTVKANLNSRAAERRYNYELAKTGGQGKQSLPERSIGREKFKVTKGVFYKRTPSGGQVEVPLNNATNQELYQIYLEDHIASQKD
jgi:hypothetical protein